MNIQNIIASPPDPRDYQFQPSGVAIPSRIDLRQFDRPIRDQANEGSCVPHAILGALENMMMRGANRALDLAPQFPYYVGRNREGRLAEEGTWIRDILEVGRKVGFCIESECLYTPDDENINPSPAAYASAATRQIHRYESIQIDPDNYIATVNNLKAAITEASLNRGSTVIFAIKLTNQFYDISGPLASHNYLGLASNAYRYIGNHAMSAPAFDDHLNGGAFISRNQWTNGWGDGGYVAIPYVTMAADMMEAWLVRSFDDVDMTDQALAANRMAVTALYAALFGRAPERDGLAYWASQLAAGVAVQGVAQAMYDCSPSRAYYPAGATSTQIVGQFYRNVLGREVDANGLAYWAAQLNSGRMPGSVIVDMINAVVAYAGTDLAALMSQRLFANKVDIGLYCAVDLACNNVNLAHVAFAQLTDDPATVELAMAAIRVHIGSGML